MPNQDTTYMHEELKEGDRLYVSKTATQVLQEQEKDKYWEVQYSFVTCSDGYNDYPTEFTGCSIGVMAENKYELLCKLGAFMEYQAGVLDSRINVLIKSEHNGTPVIERLTYNQQTKAFTPVVVN